MPLVLTGNLKLGTADSDGVSNDDASEVGDEVIAFKLSANVNTIEVPATFTTPIHGRGGANDFSVEVGYLSNDVGDHDTATAWLTATAYVAGDFVTSNGHAWVCTSGHTSGSTTHPGSGASYRTVWASADSLFNRLWTAIAAAEDGTGYIYFEGSMRKEAVSASNPLWSGVFVVIEADIGGTAQDLSQGSTTFPLVQAPDKATS